MLTAGSRLQGSEASQGHKCLFAFQREAARVFVELRYWGDSAALAPSFAALEKQQLNFRCALNSLDKDSWLLPANFA